MRERVAVLGMDGGERKIAERGRERAAGGANEKGQCRLPFHQWRIDYMGIGE